MSNVAELNVNGTRRSLNARSHRSLLSVLRDDLDLTGTKYGCGEGQCGACTVLIDGVPVRSCQLPVSAVGEKVISTIEGLEQHGRLHALQEAFLEVEAMQCAYCTSGMIMSGVALLAKNRNPSEEQIIQAMSGNLCRCGTYPRIMEAIKRAAAALRTKS